MKIILLQHFFKLHVRKVISETVSQFWEMDSHETYHLLDMINQVIKQEEEEMKDAKKGTKGNKSQRFNSPEDNPDTLSLYNQVTGRDGE